jgi:hypothetical protein
MEKRRKHLGHTPKSKPKRVGRPTKQPVSGERVSLGLRVTAEIKSALDNAAAMSGRSQSQEAEWRLQNSLESDKHLMLVQGHRATPVVFHEGKMLIPVGIEAVAVPISVSDFGSILDYFREQYPLPGPEYLDEEIEEAGERYMRMQRDIEEGK